MKRLKQTVERLRMRSSGSGAAFHRPDEAVAVVGERGHDGPGNRGFQAGKIGYQDLDRDLAPTVAGGKSQERECGDA